MDGRWMRMNGWMRVSVFVRYLCVRFAARHVSVQPMKSESFVDIIDRPNGEQWPQPLQCHCTSIRVQSMRVQCGTLQPILQLSVCDRTLIEVALMKKSSRTIKVLDSLHWAICALQFASISLMGTLNVRLGSSSSSLKFKYELIN